MHVRTDTHTNPHVPHTHHTQTTHTHEQVLEVKQLVEVEDRGSFFPARVLSLDDSSDK